MTLSQAVQPLSVPSQATQESSQLQDAVEIRTNTDESDHIENPPLVGNSIRRFKPFAATHQRVLELRQYNHGRPSKPRRQIPFRFVSSPLKKNFGPCHRKGKLKPSNRKSRSSNFESFRINSFSKPYPVMPNAKKYLDSVYRSNAIRLSKCVMKSSSNFSSVDHSLRSSTSSTDSSKKKNSLLDRLLFQSESSGQSFSAPIRNVYLETDPEVRLQDIMAGKWRYNSSDHQNPDQSEVASVATEHDLPGSLSGQSSAPPIRDVFLGSTPDDEPTKRWENQRQCENAETVVNRVEPQVQTQNAFLGGLGTHSNEILMTNSQGSRSAGSSKKIFGASLSPLMNHSKTQDSRFPSNNLSYPCPRNRLSSMITYEQDSPELPDGGISQTKESFQVSKNFLISPLVTHQSQIVDHQPFEITPNPEPGPFTIKNLSQSVTQVRKQLEFLIPSNLRRPLMEAVQSVNESTSLRTGPFSAFWTSSAFVEEELVVISQVKEDDQNMEQTLSSPIARWCDPHPFLTSSSDH
ncbi:hypothetical protein CROQUDRAFT_88865 [Cronartium quercuum f. sp. fusiforme G11]|uniref:Uncharacterized protein n=1 Tax=Cronartium quercuum f. sp. fusiforme G11 TaxID=708437 RepID=A0A9P6TGH1_9BASI|nr:hypothetical protein CROQUDRAFT_88865 [Cronartium quercuum f. sp. fusiforme G11]